VSTSKPSIFDFFQRCYTRARERRPQPRRRFFLRGAASRVEHWPGTEMRCPDSISGVRDHTLAVNALWAPGGACQGSSAVCSPRAVASQPCRHLTRHAGCWSSPGSPTRSGSLDLCHAQVLFLRGPSLDMDLRFRGRSSLCSLGRQNLTRRGALFPASCNDHHLPDRIRSGALEKNPGRSAMLPARTGKVFGIPPRFERGKKPPFLQ